MKKASLTRYIHSRAAAIMLMIVAVCTALLLPGNSASPSPTAGTGFASFPSADHWLDPGTLSATLNILANIAIALMLLVINRTFRLMQSITWIFTGLFFFMQLAQPGALIHFYCGSFVALTVLSLTALLFSTFTSPRLTRTTFLIFLLLAIASFATFNLIFFIPVFLLGMLQMKTADLRNILAAAMGCITPLWILLGTGTLTIDDLQLPSDSIAVASTVNHTAYVATLSATAFTGALGIIFTFANFIKVMSYNSARRAFNGFMTLLFLATLILIVADLHSLTVYTPLLNAVVAYQAGHFFSSRRFKLSYIPYVVILLIYSAITALPLL